MEFIHYPAGEIECRVDSKEPKEYRKFRLNSPKAIVEMLAYLSAMKHLNKTVVLDIPYVPYARNDRVFVDGGSFGMEMFAEMLIPYAGIIDAIRTCDIHSQTSFDILAGICEVVDSMLGNELILAAGLEGSVAVVAPDKGAVSRALFTGYPVMKCDKVRNPVSGKLEGFELVSDVIPADNYVIVDDLIDGGGTFVGVSELLKKATGKKPSLCVTHGIFSKGFDICSKFDKVVTTDSFRTDFPEVQNLIIVNI